MVLPHWAKYSHIAINDHTLLGYIGLNIAWVASGWGRKVDPSCEGENNGHWSLGPVGYL